MRLGSLPVDGEWSTLGSIGSAKQRLVHPLVEEELDLDDFA